MNACSWFDAVREGGDPPHPNPLPLSTGGEGTRNMLYLSGTTAPQNLEQLTQSLTAGLREFIQAPGDKPLVDLRGSYPGLDQLSIDLTGCRVDPNRRPPRPQPSGRPSPGITAQ